MPLGLGRTNVEEFATSEIGMTAVGVVIGAVVHMLGESLFDGFFESRHPDKYPVYSTGATSGVLTTVAVALILYGGSVRWYLLQYLGAGFLFVEIGSWLDIVRVNFEIGR